MSELTCLELSVVLWLVHVLVQASCRQRADAVSATCSPRATSPPKRSGVAVRSSVRGRWGTTSRTSRRSSPSRSRLSPPSERAALGAIGATIWILARIVYLPIYVFGIIYVRTAVWAISIVGLVMMLGRLIGW